MPILNGKTIAVDDNLTFNGKSGTVLIVVSVGDVVEGLFAKFVDGSYESIDGEKLKSVVH